MNKGQSEFNFCKQSMFTFKETKMLGFIAIINNCQDLKRKIDKEQALGIIVKTISRH